jgi:hypothetical protein
MVVEINYGCVRAPRLRLRVRKEAGQGEAPSSAPPLASTRSRWSLTAHPRPGETGSDRAATTRQTNLYACSPRAGLAPRSHPNPQQTHSYNQRPALTPGRPFGRSSAQYSFYVSQRRTSHSVDDLSRRASSKVHQLFCGKTKRPTVQLDRSPDATLPQRRQRRWRGSVERRQQPVRAWRRTTRCCLWHAIVCPRPYAVPGAPKHFRP